MARSHGGTLPLSGTCDDRRTDEHKHDEDDEPLRPADLRVARVAQREQVGRGGVEEALVEDGGLLEGGDLHNGHTPE